jgi:hypothetical protein
MLWRAYVVDDLVRFIARAPFTDSAGPFADDAVIANAVQALAGQRAGYVVDFAHRR